MAVLAALLFFGLQISWTAASVVSGPGVGLEKSGMHAVEVVDTARAAP
jgi:hypothetical protein